MGQTLNAVTGLGQPFLSVDEQVFVVPEVGSHEVVNDHFKVVALLRGDCLLDADGYNAAAMTRGDVLIVPETCRYRYRTSSRGGMRIHAVRLLLDPRHVPPKADDSFPAADGAGGDADVAKLVRDRLRRVVIVPAQRNIAIAGVLGELRAEAERRLTGHRCRITALCTLLMVHLVRHHAAAELADRTAVERSGARLVNIAKEYLLKNLAAPVRLADVARHLDVSAEHLARVFRRETGHTVFEQLEQFRLEQARTYLISSDWSVAEIAARTGYSSASIFSRNFRRRVGASPSRYRQDRWHEAALGRATDHQPHLG